MASQALCAFESSAPAEESVDGPHAASAAAMVPTSTKMASRRTIPALVSAPVSVPARGPGAPAVAGSWSVDQTSYPLGAAFETS
jgi:hypothetical protein